MDLQDVNETLEDAVAAVKSSYSVLHLVPLPSILVQVGFI